MSAVRVLTPVEVQKLLKTTAEHRDGFRDHVIFTLALKTGLREHELLALNIGDVFADGKAKRWVQLRVFKRSSTDASAQQVALNDVCRAKLEQLYKSKFKAGHELADSSPVFVSKKGARLSSRMLRHAFKTWQVRAAFERIFTFHALRHTACTRLYAVNHDVKLVQKFARHTNVSTTNIYVHASDVDLARAVEFI